jgi:hypothetical protein
MSMVIATNHPTRTAQSRRVYIWLAYMARTEASSIAYAYPRPDGWELAYDELSDASDRCHALACAGLSDDESRAAWRDAMDAWEQVPGGTQ